MGEAGQNPASPGAANPTAWRSSSAERFWRQIASLAAISVLGPDQDTTWRAMATPRQTSLIAVPSSTQGSAHNRRDECEAPSHRKLTKRLIMAQSYWTSSANVR